MMIRDKQKYKAYILIEQGSTFKLKKIKKINPLKDTFKFGGKPFSPDIDNPTYIKGNTSYYLFDFHSQKQIKTKKGNNEIDAHTKDLIYAREVIVQVFRSLEKRTFYITWMHVVLVLGLALLGGWILGSYFPIQALS